MSNFEVPVCVVKSRAKKPDPHGSAFITSWIRNQEGKKEKY